MKLINRYLLSFFVGLFFTQAYAHLPDLGIKDKSISLAPVLTNATSAVVNIAVEKVVPSTNPSNTPDTKTIGVGSGVIIDDKKGLIITNTHVVKNQHIMIVTLKDRRRFRAKLIASDDSFDIAIIQIPGQHLTAMPLGDSDQLKVGDFVVAIGSPFGLTQTVTSGIISALNRSEPDIEGFQNFIQTDAPINPGNSGGALINMQGQFIGMNTAIFTPMVGNIGIGFAIPSNIIKSAVQQLIEYGEVSRGVLGVIAQNITPELADALKINSEAGALVAQVVALSPAEKAGLQVKDIIQKVNDTPIRNSEQLHNMMGLIRPKTDIKLTVLRDHHTLSLTATSADPKKMQQKIMLPFLDGMRLRDFTELESDGTTIKGVLVVAVKDTSDAAMAGLMQDDVILSANGEDIQSISELQKIIKTKPKQLLLKINRGVGNLFLVVQHTNNEQEN